jgi:hypothetical protein
MAPEVISPTTTVTPYNEKIDVFSFSILLWEMASDKRAIDMLTVKSSDDGAYDLARLRDEIVRGRRPDVEDILGDYIHGEKIAKLLEDCWNTLPALRPSFSIIRVHTPAVAGIMDWWAGNDVF